MSVGKGSIKRAAQAQTEAVQEVKKPAAGKTTAKKPVAKKTAVVAKSVISSDDIHEKKFEAVSKIHCDLPIYLL